jgi:hypothetical protein
MSISLETLKIKDAKEILDTIKETEFNYNRMTNKITLSDEKIQNN